MESLEVSNSWKMEEVATDIVMPSLKLVTSAVILRVVGRLRKALFKPRFSWRPGSMTPAITVREPSLIRRPLSTVIFLKLALSKIRPDMTA